MRRRNWMIILTLVLIAAACEAGGRRGSAADLMPNVPNAKIVTGMTISEYIASLAEGGSLLTGNPALVAAIEFTQGAIDCYQGLGAVAVRVYSDETFPLSSGVVAIVDRNAITDVGNLARCLGGGQQAGAQGVIEACAHTYTLTKDDNEFYIAYIGTTAQMCQAFCTGLEGCTASQP